MGTQTNPLAPLVYSGYNDAAPTGYVDVDWSLPYDVVLTSLQSLPDQAKTVDVDADFIWRGIVAQNQTGPYIVRFSDSQGYFISQGYISNATLLGDPASPFIIFPDIVIPAGGRIGIDIADTSGNPNTIQILFRGVKRYRVATS